jgi:V/A-type H+-transporting ATPase subunit E
MDADKVTEKILSDARDEAEKIKRQAAEKEAAEQAGLNERLGEYKKQTEMLAKKAAEDKKAHLLSAARMQIAKEHLAEKTKILDEVFSQARQQFKNLPDNEYRALMTKLMVAAAQTGDPATARPVHTYTGSNSAYAETSEEVVIDVGEIRIDQQLIDQVNARLAGKGRLKPAGQREQLGGGFVLRRGKIKNNVSLKVLLTEARKAMEIELAKDLFAGL